ncbi:MAG: thiamine-phosphate kinase, partial [Ktedonobacteraceae bacterium]|nr:thiamine-phosphate kinase [Ktedonobacteraceae bacterium]
MSSGGEFELIARLTRGLVGGAGVEEGIGDDCALLDPGGDEHLLATCDSQVEGNHFTLHTSTPQQIGRKALAVNLSDIAAMGGIPRYALISLILPPQCPALDEIYAGLREEAERYGTVIVGGNIATTGRTGQLIIDITLLGTVERGRALLRSGAQAGDLLCVTGQPGESAAGLHTLLYPNPDYASEALEVVQARHQTPQPRLREGRILNRFGPQIVTALIDVSDGISGDLGHLCERSRLGALVETERLPLSAPLRSIAATAAHDPYAWFLHGGEDYELLFTVTPVHAQPVIEAIQSET